MSRKRLSSAQLVHGREAATCGVAAIRSGYRDHRPTNEPARVLQLAAEVGEYGVDASVVVCVAGEVEFLEDVADVGFDCPRREPEQLADSAVREALGDKLENFAF